MSSRPMLAEYAGRDMETKQEKDPGRVSKESHLWTKPKTRHADVGEMLARAGRCFVASDWRARPPKLCSLFGEVTMTLRASETSKVHSAYEVVQLLHSECRSQCQRCPIDVRGATGRGGLDQTAAARSATGASFSQRSNTDASVRVDIS